MSRTDIINLTAGRVLEMSGALFGMMATAIISDPALRMWCIFGAAIGAFVAVAISPNAPRCRQVVQWLAGALVSVVATPAVMRYLQWSAEPDVVLGVAAFVGLIAWATVPMVQGFVERFLNSKIPPDKNKDGQ